MLTGKDFKVPDYTKSQHALIGKAPDSKRIDAWKKNLTASEIYQVEKYLGDLLGMMGYKRTGIHPADGNFLKSIVLKLRNDKLINIFKRIRFLLRVRKYNKDA
jgi:hypothetical protein